MMQDDQIKDDLPQTSQETPGEVKEKSEKKGKVGAVKKRGKKKSFRQIPVGKVYISATYNNTLVSFTDLQGNVLGWASAGGCGFKGPKKSTPYAASVIVRTAVEKIKGYGLTEVSVFVKGVGSGREAAIRALNANGLQVGVLKDITPIPHNGCRAPKVRRV